MTRYRIPSPSNKREGLSRRLDGSLRFICDLYFLTDEDGNKYESEEQWDFTDYMVFTDEWWFAREVSNLYSDIAQAISQSQVYVH